MAKLIDTHFHLDMYKDYAEKYKYIVENCQYTLCVTNSPGVFLSCKNIFQENKYLKFALGLHPLNSQMKESDLRDFFHLLPETQYVGEIGLDFSKYTRIDRAIQIKFFDKIVEACSLKNKAMSIHIRGAEKEALEILEKYHPKKCIIHWFTGDRRELQNFLDLGCYFSINANMVKNKVSIVKSIPKNKILIESDGPFSKVNEKKYSPEMLETQYKLIAQTLNEPQLIKIVWNNFSEFLKQ